MYSRHYSLFLTGRYGPPEPEAKNELAGIVPRAAHQVFEQIRTGAATNTYTIHCSFVEVYKERVADLLNVSNCNLRVREDKNGSTYIQDVTRIPIDSEADVMTLIQVLTLFD